MALVMQISRVERNEKSVLHDILGWLQERSYTREEAEEVASRLHAHKELWLALRELALNGDEQPMLAQSGISYFTLRSKFRMTSVDALLTLAWLKEDPAEAFEALRYGIR